MTAIVNGIQYIGGSTAPDEFIKNQAGTIDGDQTIENALKGLGVEWLKTVHTYEVGSVKKVLFEAINSSFKGLKVIIAEGECQLERH